MKHILVVVSTKEAAYELAGEVHSWITALLGGSAIRKWTAHPFYEIDLRNGNICTFLAQDNLLRSSCGRRADLLFIDEGISISRECMEILLPMTCHAEGSSIVQRVDIKKIVKGLIF